MHAIVNIGTPTIPNALVQTTVQKQIENIPQFYEMSQEEDALDDEDIDEGSGRHATQQPASADRLLRATLTMQSTKRYDIKRQDDEQGSSSDSI